MCHVIPKRRWIELYGGQELLDREGFEVVPCTECEDAACKGWRVRRKDRFPVVKMCPCHLSLQIWAVQTVDGYWRCPGCKRVYGKSGSLIA